MTPEQVAAKLGRVEPCPQCRDRHGCRQDCGNDLCACRGVFAERLEAAARAEPESTTKTEDTP